CIYRMMVASEVYTLSLHDALPISGSVPGRCREDEHAVGAESGRVRDRQSASGKRAAARKQGNHLPIAGLAVRIRQTPSNGDGPRSEEHTSELQSRENLVCRLLLEK